MPLNTRRKYSQEELKTMADQLEAALICLDVYKRQVF